MVEVVVVTILISLIIAYSTEKIVVWGNDNYPELNMQNKWWAFVALMFGLRGMIFTLIYGAIKLLFKRVVKK